MIFLFASKLVIYGTGNWSMFIYIVVHNIFVGGVIVDAIGKTRNRWEELEDAMEEWEERFHQQP